jgi:IS30 family transposase
MALELNLHIATINRELARNTGLRSYQPQLAHKASTQRKATAKKSNKSSTKLKSTIEKGLCLGWSPDAINERMKL